MDFTLSLTKSVPGDSRTVKPLISKPTYSGRKKTVNEGRKTILSVQASEDELVAKGRPNKFLLGKNLCSSEFVQVLHIYLEAMIK